MDSVAVILLMAAFMMIHVQSDNTTDPFVESRYHDNDELVSLLRSLTSQYPNLARLRSIGKSFEGNDLWVIQISDNVRQRELLEPKFKYVANVHGNEVVGRELLINLAQYLLKNYNTSSRVKNLVDNTDIYLLPSINPDGFAKAKPLECFGLMGRRNAQDVDINKDFPEQFSKTIKTTFTPETRAIMNWIQKQPNFVLSASMHGGAVVACYPFDSASGIYRSGRYSATPDDSLFRSLALTYANPHPDMKTGRQCDEYFEQGIVNGAFWYPERGGMQDYNYVHSNSYEITLELSCCKYPDAKELPTFWRKNKESLLAYMERVHTGVKGTVYYTDGNPVRGAHITLDYSTHPVLTSDKGEFWRLAEPGSHIFTITLPHTRHSKSKRVVIVDHKPTVLTVRISLKTKKIYVRVS